ncbi:MAG: hypothetical protein IJW67_09375 [Blautia sp.]|nr:hypothetical protein [Blautia sp.]
MKNEYTSRELRRLPGVTYDTLRTWAGRRNTDKHHENSEKGNTGKPQPVLLSPLRKPGSTQCWIYGKDAVERIWWIRMLQMLGYKNVQIETILDSPDHKPGKEVWESLDGKINDLRWKIQHLSKAQQFAETIRSVGKLPDFPHCEDVDDIDRYLEVLPVDPKVASSDYESGSRELMKAHGIDRDAVIAQSNSPELLNRRHEIYLSIRKLHILQTPADSPQVYALVDMLYTESFEKQGFDLSVFHSAGTLFAKEHKLDGSYGSEFSIFLAEAIFIYCFVQSLPSNEEARPEDNN